ncbi:MAG: outer-membrane lipoprotein carrier protein LolA [Pseudomonadota bacterium]
MVSSTLTAIALVWTFGQHAVPAALSTMQAIPAEEDLVDPATTRPDVIEPPAVAIDPAITPVAEPVAQIKETADTISETTTPVADPTVTDPIPPRPLSEPVRKEVTTLPPSIQPRRYQEVQARVPAGSTEMMTRHVEGTNGYRVFLERARTSLSSAKTASGRFTQANADGSIYGGAFALSRPGKLRFDYDDPVPVLIVSDGTTVAMEDSELETIDRIPLGATPLGLILNDDLRFTDDVIVNSVIEREAGYEITVEDATGEMPGTLTMLFDKSSNALSGWRAVDAELNMTRVSLSDVETNQRINPRQFILRDAEDEEDER